MKHWPQNTRMVTESLTAVSRRVGLGMLIGNWLVRLHKATLYLLVVIPAQAGIQLFKYDLNVSHIRGFSE